jgi:hypothetical protein
MSQENMLLNYMLSQERNRASHTATGNIKLESHLESQLLELTVKELISKAASLVRHEMELSQLSFSRVNETTGQILEIQEEKVVIRCLIDEENKEFQIRNFDREPFEGAVIMEVGAFVGITVFTKPGERRFLFRSVAGDPIKHLFEPQNIFEEFIDSPIFNPIPSVDEDQL